MQMVGIDCGPVRRPIDPASLVQIAALRVELEKMGWFEWVVQDSQISIR